MEILNKLVLELLDTDCYKTAAYLAEELHIEYQQEFKSFLKSYQKEYHLSGCGAQMSSITAVNASLNSLFNKGKVEKTVEGGISRWRLSHTVQA